MTRAASGPLGLALRYVFLLRYPILVGLTLVLLPFVARSRVMTANLFVVDASDLFWIAFLAIWTSWVIVTTGGHQARLAPERFGFDASRLWPWARALGRWGWRKRGVVTAALAAPLVVAAWADCTAARWQATLAALGGAATTAVIAMGFHRLESRLPTYASLEARWPRLVGLTSRLFARLGEGYWDGGAPRTEHVRMLLLLVLTLAVYVTVGWMFRPNGPHPEGLPAVAYLLFLLMLAGWLLSGVSFLLDRPRVPTLPALLALSMAGFMLGRTDHVYDVIVEDVIVEGREAPAARAAAPAADDLARQTRHYPATRVFERLDAFEANRTLERTQEPREERARDRPPPEILVAASGGGVTAAAWTTGVLTRLEAELGADFTKSLRVISAVSGGSVGTVFYLTGFERAVPRSPETLLAARCRAAHTSLRQAAWGIAYPDAWRLLFAPVLLLTDNRDRAWALEEAWRYAQRLQFTPTEPWWRCEVNAEVPQGDLSFGTWRADIEKGLLPIPIFGATIVETGEMLLLSPVALHAGGASARFFKGYRTSEQLFGLPSTDRSAWTTDIDVVTAARLSATFPFVSPIARPRLVPAALDDESRAAEQQAIIDGETAKRKYGWHVADGGYYDNFGVAALAAWIRATNAEAPVPGRRVLVLEIRASGDPGLEPDAEVDDDTANRGWIYAMGGPLLTLLNVRSSSQVVRNNAEMELLRAAMDDGRTSLSRVCVTLGEELPLSWQLAGGNLETLDRALQGKAVNDAIGRVRSFLQGDGPGDACTTAD